MNPKIAKVVVGLPVDGPFDYKIGNDCQDRIAVGTRVRVSFNRRNRVGFVVGQAQRSRFKRLNPILSVLDEAPVLDSHAFELAKMFSAYYGCSLGEAIETFLPKALRHDRSSSNAHIPTLSLRRSKTVKKKPILVHDQTRHQRWSLVIKHIQKAIDKKKRVIVLVPEVSFVKDALSALMPALTCPITVFNKKLSPKKELEQWEEIRNGEYSVIVGTRSAVFAPVAHLGLIVIDEEDNDAYKQEQMPHYRVHEVARMRSAIDQCQIMFISSLPNAETWQQAKKEQWERVTFKDTRKTKIQIVDMTNYNPGRTSILSFPLQSAIQKTLENRGKVVLFMNRRGFSTRMHCQECGYTMKCDRCNVNLTFLYSQKMMVCRHCPFKLALPKICPECHGRYLRSSGTGIEKLESEVARLYPDARIQHYDATSKTFPKQTDIIIATQALFRQHDQDIVSLAAILNFDAQMIHMDFRSGQKALALLMRLNQLAKNKLLIQTRMMDSYCIKVIQRMDFTKFYREELKLRKELQLPPYKHLVAIGLRGKKEDIVFEQCTALHKMLEEKKPKSLEVTDPHPDVNPKLRDQYRFTVVVKGSSVKNILAHVKAVLKQFKRKSVIVTINVDP